MELQEPNHTVLIRHNDGKGEPQSSRCLTVSKEERVRFCWIYDDESDRLKRYDTAFIALVRESSDGQGLSLWLDIRGINHNDPSEIIRYFQSRFGTTKLIEKTK